MRITTLLVLFVSLIYAQGVPGGTINGKAIPASVFTAANACGQLAETIRSEAQDIAARDMGISVTPDDIAAVRKTVHTPDPVAESKRIIDHTTLMISALTAVDRGQDQHQVYLQMLQPKGVVEAEWTSYLQQWKVPAERANIEGRLGETPEVIAKQLGAVDYSLLARKRKLDEAVDQELAGKDAQFRTALDHSKAPRMPFAEQQYLATQRAQWWQARDSKLSVVLNDPTWFAKCSIRGATK